MACSITALEGGRLQVTFLPSGGGEPVVVGPVCSQGQADLVCDVLTAKAALDAGQLPTRDGLRCSDGLLGWLHAFGCVGTQFDQDSAMCTTTLSQLVQQLQECCNHAAGMPCSAGPNQCALVHAAAFLGHRCSLQLMLMLDSNPHALLCGHCYGQEGPLLHSAAAGGQAGTAALLLDLSPASATARDELEELALHWAAKGGHSDVAALLLHAAPEAAARQNMDRATPLLLAAENGQVGVLELLLRALPEATIRPPDVAAALQAAAQGGHTAAMRVILAAAPHAATATTGQGSCAMHGAAAGGSAEALQLLLQVAPTTAISTNAQGLTPAHTAAQHGRSTALQLLLAAAPETAHALDSSGNSPMHRAAAGGHAEVVELLLGVAPGTAAATNGFGSTPLLLAAASQSAAAPAVVQLLLDAATETAMVANKDLDLPLHVAAHPGSAHLLLTAAPEAATRTNGDGLVPLLCGLDSGNAGLVQFWLKVGLAEQVVAHLGSMHEQQPFKARRFYAAFVAARLPLSEELWSRIPTLLPEAAQALLAALACSAQQARQVVRRLPEDSRQRLQLFALCLARMQRRLRVPLPGPLAGRIMALIFSA